MEGPPQPGPRLPFHCLPSFLIKLLVLNLDHSLFPECNCLTPSPSLPLSLWQRSLCTPSPEKSTCCSLRMNGHHDAVLLRPFRFLMIFLSSLHVYSIYFFLLRRNSYPPLCLSLKGEGRKKIQRTHLASLSSSIILIWKAENISFPFVQASLIVPYFKIGHVVLSLWDLPANNMHASLAPASVWQGSGHGFILPCWVGSGGKLWDVWICYRTSYILQSRLSEL